MFSLVRLRRTTQCISNNLYKEKEPRQHSRQCARLSRHMSGFSSQQRQIFPFLIRAALGSTRPLKKWAPFLHPSLPLSYSVVVCICRDILHHAASRHVEVIPEIDMPGHSHAAIKAMQARFVKYASHAPAEATRCCTAYTKAFILSHQTSRTITSCLFCVALQHLYDIY